MICITPGSLHVLWRRNLGILGLEMNADVRSGQGKTRTEDQKSPEHSISMKSSSESSSHPIDLTNKPILKQEIFPGARCQCDEDPRSIPATDSFTKANHELSSYHIKEEPQSKVKEHHLLDVSHTNLADHRAHMLSCIKEEPSLPYTDIKVELFSDNPEIKPERLLHNKICDPPAHVLCHLTEIKEEPQSPDVDSPRDISTPADHIPSVRIKEEEDFPDAGIHILKGTITDSDVHSFTITGEYIEGIEIKLTTPLGDSPLSSKTTYSCPVCKRTFSNHGNLARHRETHKGKKMSCSECGADFCNKVDLMAHARFHKANRVLHCSECNITFRSNSHLIIHKRIHTGEKPFACPQCGKRFYSKSNVAGHMKVHTGSKQYCCSTCGKSYARKENLYSHQRIHQEAPTFTCAHCGQCFVDEHKFTRHQRFHTLEKPYPCILCGKRFAHKARLLRHERTHAGENLVCSDCGKCFFRQAELTKHKRAHMGVTEKLFECMECGKCFSSGPRLISHQKMHTADRAYKCSECGNCFKQKNDLVRHQRVHEVEKPFWCDECDRGFTTRSNFKVHRRVHIMRRQHPCPHCSKEFPFKSRLNEHLKSHEKSKMEDGQS